MRRTLLLLAAIGFFVTAPLFSQGGEAVAEPQEQETGDVPAADGETVDEQRTELNLLGQTAAAAGESRRNENVQFNPIDNNALRELNIRMGVTATLVEDFEAEQNYFGAEFGAGPSSSRHAGAASAQDLHGDAFFRHDNSVFRARSFFQVGDVQPARENDYGFTVGSSLFRGAAFTADASRQRIRGNVNGNVLVPLADERTPLTNDPEAHALVQSFLDAYPAVAPNRPDINPRALNINAPQRINTDAAGAKLSLGGGGRDLVTLDYRFTQQLVDAFQFVAGQNPDTAVRNHSSRITWTRTWGPALVSDFTVGFRRVGSLLTPEENAVGPSVSIGGIIETLGPSSRIPIDRAQNDFFYAGRARRTFAKHSLTFGGELLRRQFNGAEVSSHRGVYQFSGNFGRDALTNLRLGVPSRFSTGIGDPHRGFRDWRGVAYLGDSWQAARGLTLSLGVRYEPISSPVEVNGLTEIPYSCDCNNVSSQFGFAQRLPQKWGVLRGAWGLHYAEVLPTTYQQARSNPPHIFKIAIPDPSLLDPLNGLTEADLDPNTPATRIVLDDQLVSPYSMQYNFGWENDFWNGWRLRLGYVGSRSQKLLMKWFLNRARPVEGVPLTTKTINQRRPDPTALDIRRVLNASRGYYDAGRATLTIPSWRGLAVETSYWFSKAMDLGTSYTDTASGTSSLSNRSQQDVDILKDLRSLSAFDQPHSFLLRMSYEIPAAVQGSGWLRRAAGGWVASSVTLVKTGTPFTVITGSDSPGLGNVDGSSGDRPNLLDPSILGRTIGRPDTSVARLPVSAFGFIDPLAGAGTLGSNTFRKAGVGNVNMSLSRRFALGGDVAMVFRAESINFFNTPQFAEPGLTLSSPNFGQITNTLNDGRTFQFGLRMLF